MRITIVLPFVNLTGGIRVLLNYANFLHDEGHRVTVVYPLCPYRYHLAWRQQVGELRKQLRAGSRIDWFDLRCRLVRVPWIASAFLPEGDLVVATSWPVAHSVARLDASKGRKVHVVFHHESGTGPEEQIAATYDLPFYRMTCSASVRESIARRFGCQMHDLVPAGVDTSMFYPDGARTSDTVLMLYHNDPRKGADDGVEALALLRERMPSVKAILCGTVRPQRLPYWMSFEFHPDDADLRRRYSTAAAFLYPSRYEGFGLPPLEAMACGCPVVTTDVGAVAEFARHRENALVVPRRDARAMADGLEELLSDGRLRHEISQRALATAQDYSVAAGAPIFRDALMRAYESSLPPAP